MCFCNCSGTSWQFKPAYKYTPIHRLPGERLSVPAQLLVSRPCDASSESKVLEKCASSDAWYWTSCWSNLLMSDHAASTPPLRVLCLLKNKIGFPRGAEGKEIPREAERSLTTLILETRSLKIVLSKERRRRRRPQRTLEPKCSVSF